VTNVQCSQMVTYQGYPYARHDTCSKIDRCSAYEWTGCRVKLYVSKLGAIVQRTQKHDCVPADRTNAHFRELTPINWHRGCHPHTKTSVLRRRQYDCRRCYQEADFGSSLPNQGEAILTGRYTGAWQPSTLCDVKHSSGIKFF
jgi:hypothetical protein